MKKFVAVLCTAATFGMSVLTAFGATDSSTAEQIQKAQSEKAATEQEISNAQNTKNALETDRVQLEGYLGELDQKLLELSGSISDLESKIQEKEQKITELQADLEQAKQDMDAQYDDMKKRIQYMYEKGTQGFYSALAGADTLGDIISKTEYITSMSKYDRQMLEKYQELYERISSDETALESEQSSLTEMQASMETQKAELEQVIATTQAELNQHNDEIAAAQQQIAEYEAQLSEQEQRLANLEAIQAAEAIADSSSEVVATANKAKTIAQGLADKMSQLGLSTSAPVSTTDITVTYGEPYAATQSDLVLLATLIYVEAGAEPFEGKIAVGACVMNRVRSSEFPNTILGVIYDPGQFTPVTTGKFAEALATGVPDSCYEAAQMALDGYNNIGDYLYFRTPNGRVSGLQIGGHIFHDGHVF